MGIEYYLFAAFVFGLGAILVVMLVKGLKKKKTEEELKREEKSKKIDIMYSEIVDILDAMESYVEDSKMQISREREEMARTLETLRGMKNHPQQLPEPEPVIVTAPLQPQPQNFQKGEMRLKALSLSSGGYSVGEIAEELNLSKGEVAFMLNLKMQNLPKRSISS